MMMKRDQLLFWKYVAPSVFAAVIGGSFAIVDAIFIGLAGGKNGLAATALTWPLVMLLQAFGFLVGSGGAVLIAQSRGANRPDQEKRFFDQTLFLVFAWSILLTVCTLPLLGTLLKFLGATAELMPVSLRYSQILICGVFFSIFMSMCLEVIRNDGHPTLSMLLMVTGLLCNIALDWLFVFPLGFGAVGAAIPASDHVEPFLAAGIEGLWTYYCCAQGREVSNRFIAMPSSRTRIIGAQLWKYRIAGFLHWGYNFWYTRFSRREIHPYVILDGGCFTPAGDCFSVYPGPDGVPYQSLHMKAFTEALSDLRAMTLAEALCGRNAVLEAVEAAGEVTFSRYPRERDAAASLRERVNVLIENAVK